MQPILIFPRRGRGPSTDAGLSRNWREQDRKGKDMRPGALNPHKYFPMFSEKVCSVSLSD